MKKSVLAIAAMLLIFVLAVGCGQQAAPGPAPAAAPEPTAAAPSAPATAAPQPSAQPEAEPEPVKQMSSKVVELLGKSQGRVTSIEYMYQDALNKPEEWKTWVKGSKIHVELRELDNVRDDVYVDNIYMNTATQKASGYCESSVYRCADPNTAIDVTYRKYLRKTPFDWLNDIGYVEKEAEETLQQRLVWKLVGETKDGKDLTMWVDEYYGMPVMVTIKEGSTKNEYIFEDIGFNGVDDSDLEHGMVTTSYKK
jgi:outer membrane lipoprotein-sorting protein